MDVSASLQAWKRWNGVLQRVRECECTTLEKQRLKQLLEEESLAWAGWLDATKKLAAEAGTQEALAAGAEQLMDAAERDGAGLEAAGWLVLELLGIADSSFIIKTVAAGAAIKTLNTMAEVLSERNLARGGLAWCTPSSRWGQLLAALLAQGAKLFRQWGTGGGTENAVGGLSPASSAASGMAPAGSAAGSAEGGAGSEAASPMLAQYPGVALDAAAALLSFTSALLRGGAAAWASPTKAAGLAVAARDLVERCASGKPWSSRPDAVPGPQEALLAFIDACLNGGDAPCQQGPPAKRRQQLLAALKADAAMPAFCLRAATDLIHLLEVKQPWHETAEGMMIAPFPRYSTFSRLASALCVLSLDSFREELLALMLQREFVDGMRWGLLAVFKFVADLSIHVGIPHNIEGHPDVPWWTSLRLMASLEQLGLALADLWVRSGSLDAPQDEQLVSLTLDLQLGMQGSAQLLANFITSATNGLSNLGWSPVGGGGARRAAPAFLAAVSACFGALTALLSVMGSMDANGGVMRAPKGSTPVGVRRGAGVWRGNDGSNATSNPSCRQHVGDMLDWLTLLCDCYRLAGQRWRQLDRLGEGCCPGARERFEGLTASQALLLLASRAAKQRCCYVCSIPMVHGTLVAGEAALVRRKLLKLAFTMGQALEATLDGHQSSILANAYPACLDAILVACKAMGEVMGPAEAAREGQAVHLALHAVSLSLRIYCLTPSRDGPLVSLSTALCVAVQTGGHLCRSDTLPGASLRAGLPHLLVSSDSGFGRLVPLPAVSRPSGPPTQTAVLVSVGLQTLLEVGHTSPGLLIATLQSGMLSRTARWILAHVHIYTDGILVKKQLMLLAQRLGKVSKACCAALDAVCGTQFEAIDRTVDAQAAEALQRLMQSGPAAAARAATFAIQKRAEQLLPRAEFVARMAQRAWVARRAAPAAAAGVAAEAGSSSGGAAGDRPAGPATHGGPGSSVAERALQAAVPLVAVEREVSFASAGLCCYPGCRHRLYNLQDTRWHHGQRVCAGCKVARFCTEECARTDWPRHRPICQALRTLRPEHG